MTETTPIQREYPHLLSLRVMRLYNSVSKNMKPIVANMSGNAKAASEPLSRAIRLPDSFGSIYTSQLFSSYLVVSNICEDLVQAENPRFKVKLTLPGGKDDVELRDCGDAYSGKVAYDTSAIDTTPQQLSGTDVMDMIVRHRIEMKGLYVLNVTVSYEDPRYGPSMNRKRAFKKIFKFNAEDAIEIVKLRRTELPKHSLLQVSFCNLLRTELCVEDIFLQEQDQKRVRPVQCILSGICEKSSVLDVDTICQNLMSPESVRHAVIRLGKDSPRIAWMVIVWRSVGGSPGYFTIPLLQDESVSTRKIHKSGSNNLSVSVLPSGDLRMGAPSKITIQVENRTNRELSLQLTLREKYALGFTFVGLTKRTLGNFQSGESRSISAMILAEHCGLLNVKKDAVVVTDLESGDRISLNKSLRIWVRDSEDKADDLSTA